MLNKLRKTYLYEFFYNIMRCSRCRYIKFLLNTNSSHVVAIRMSKYTLICQISFTFLSVDFLNYFTKKLEFNLSIYIR